MVQRNGRNPAKENYWRKQMRAQAVSGQSVARWCRQNNLSAPSFYFWKRTLAQRDDPTTPRPTRSADKPSAAFAQVLLTGAPVPASASAMGAPMAEGPIQILLRDGLAVRVAAGFDAPTLARVLDVLEARAC